MNRKVAPTLNLKNLTCVIHCCAYPSTTADNEGGRVDENDVKDGDANEDKRQDSCSPEKNLHGPEIQQVFPCLTVSMPKQKR